MCAWCFVCEWLCAWCVCQTYFERVNMSAQGFYATPGSAVPNTGDTCASAQCQCPAAETLKSPLAPLAPIAAAVSPIQGIPVLGAYAGLFAPGQAVVVANKAGLVCDATGRYVVANLSAPTSVGGREVVYLQLAAAGGAAPPATPLAAAACELGSYPSSLGWGNAWFAQTCR